MYRHIAAGGAGEAVASVHLDPFASPHRPGEVAAKTLPSPAAVVPAASAGPAVPSDFTAVIAAHELGILKTALDLAGGNQRRAAGMLALTYDQLRGLLKKHGLLAKRTPAPRPGDAEA